jgi:hypothetical protein
MGGRGMGLLSCLRVRACWVVGVWLGCGVSGGGLGRGLGGANRRVGKIVVDGAGFGMVIFWDGKPRGKIGSSFAKRIAVQAINFIAMMIWAYLSYLKPYKQPFHAHGSKI